MQIHVRTILPFVFFFIMPQNLAMYTHDFRQHFGAAPVAFLPPQPHSALPIYNSHQYLPSMSYHTNQMPPAFEAVGQIPQTFGHGTGFYLPPKVPKTANQHRSNEGVKSLYTGTNRNRNRKPAALGGGQALQSRTGSNVDANKRIYKPIVLHDKKEEDPAELEQKMRNMFGQIARNVGMEKDWMDSKSGTENKIDYFNGKRTINATGNRM